MRASGRHVRDGGNELVEHLAASSGVQHVRFSRAGGNEIDANLHIELMPQSSAARYDTLISVRPANPHLFTAGATNKGLTSTTAELAARMIFYMTVTFSQGIPQEHERIGSAQHDAVISTCHSGQFRSDAVIDVMRMHPMVIIGGILQRNPFFVPPEQFVPEFRERRAKLTMPG